MMGVLAAYKRKNHRVDREVREDREDQEDHGDREGRERDQEARRDRQAGRRDYREDHQRSWGDHDGHQEDWKNQEDRQDGLGARPGDRMNREESDYRVDEGHDLDENDGRDRQKNHQSDYHQDHRGQHQLWYGDEHGVILIDEKVQTMERSHGVLVYSIRHGEDEDHHEVHRWKKHDVGKHDEMILEERLYSLVMEKTERIVG